MSKNKHFQAKLMNIEPKYAQVLGVNVLISDMDGVIEIVKNQIEDYTNKGAKHRPFFIVTLNPEIAVKTVKNKKFKIAVKEADLVICDGNGLKFANSDLKVVAGRKLVGELLKMNKKVFYLGGMRGAAGEMQKKFGGMADEGAENIKLVIENNVSEPKLIEKINNYAPDILLVAYGAPWQEFWIQRYKKQLNVGVVIGVGGTFDFLTGRVAKVPEKVSLWGFEWLWRLIHEPKRLKRQLIGGMFFVYVLKQKFKSIFK